MMNKYKKHLVIFVFSILFCTAQADTLVLTNGLSLEGKYKGGTETTIKFETSGAIQEVAISEIKSLSFSAPEVKAQSSSPTTTPAVAVAGAASVATTVAVSGTQIPAGTKLMIKTTEDISTASHQAGAMFKATLEADLILNGAVVAPKGSEIYGIVLESVGGRRIGNQRIVVSFDKISINGQLVVMDTDDVGAEGGRGGAARAVGAGAISKIFTL